jgi:hypothetical protein
VRPRSFTSAAPIRCDGTFDDSDLTFDPGDRARSFWSALLQWPLLTPFLEQALGDVDGATALIITPTPSATSLSRPDPSTLRRFSDDGRGVAIVEFASWRPVDPFYVGMAEICQAYMPSAARITPQARSAPGRPGGRGEHRRGRRIFDIAGVIMQPIRPRAVEDGASVRCA